MSNQDELRGFWASRETCTPPNKDHDEQVALHSRFKDITDQDLIRLEGSQPPKLSGGNLTPVAPVRTPIGAVYYKFLSLTASTIFHTGSNQLYLNISIIEEEDSGTNDEDDSPEHGLSAPDINSKLKDMRPQFENLITKFKDPPLFLFSSISGRYGPVNIFYDTGNSHCLFCKGTAKNLYGVRVKKGPQPLGAVGGTTLWGGEPGLPCLSPPRVAVSP